MIHKMLFQHDFQNALGHPAQHDGGRGPRVEERQGTSVRTASPTFVSAGRHVLAYLAFYRKINQGENQGET